MRPCVCVGWQLAGLGLAMTYVAPECMRMRTPATVDLRSVWIQGDPLYTHIVAYLLCTTHGGWSQCCGAQARPRCHACPHAHARKPALHPPLHSPRICFLSRRNRVLVRVSGTPPPSPLHLCLRPRA